MSPTLKAVIAFKQMTEAQRHANEKRKEWRDAMADLSRSKQREVARVAGAR